jgi:hypothetical protein
VFGVLLKLLDIVGDRIQKVVDEMEAIGPGSA